MPSLLAIKIVAFICLLALFFIMPVLAKNPTRPWFDGAKRYRVKITACATPFADELLEIPVNFSQLLKAKHEPVDIETIRIVETSHDGLQELSSATPFQFDKASNFSLKRVAGTLLFITKKSDQADADRMRYYEVYFDTSPEARTPPPTPAPLLTMDTQATDEGMDCLRITNKSAVFFFQKQAGGLSSLFDKDGADWINFNASIKGPAGTYRGLPNMVNASRLQKIKDGKPSLKALKLPPEHAPPAGYEVVPIIPRNDYFHPGFSNCKTEIVHEGPLKITLKAASDDGGWICLWEFLPDYARMTVLKAKRSYWFLYEGTPGGGPDCKAGHCVRMDGEKLPLDVAWKSVSSGLQWAYFESPNSENAFYLAHNATRPTVMSYWLLDDAMTVFGFGRDGMQQQLRGAGQEFLIGFLDNKQQSFDKTSSYLRAISGKPAGRLQEQVECR
ncbi:MAG: hypothetical protein WCS65_02005 [Verrucomicrobiae bacterium]